MNYIVIGCGRVGSELAYRLYKRGYKVTVVDREEKAFANLPEDFRGRTLEGEALSQVVLRRAGIETAAGMAIVTSSDMLNAVIGHVAQSFYKVPVVVVRNYDPHYRAMEEAFNLQVVSSATWGAQRIEELLYSHDLRAVFSAGNGEVELYEFRIPAAWNGRSLNALLPEAGCCATALTRAGRALLPLPESVLQTGDIVLLGATLDGVEAVRRNLAQQEKPERPGAEV
jgi:trk system potassium uptake protein